MLFGFCLSGSGTTSSGGAMAKSEERSFQEAKDKPGQPGETKDSLALLLKART